jgi:hypothetical protein
MELQQVSRSNGTPSNGSSSSVNLAPLLTGQFSNSRSDQKKAKALSDAIDRSLRADRERQLREGGIKLLILGKETHNIQHTNLLSFILPSGQGGCETSLPQTAVQKNPNFTWKTLHLGTLFLSCFLPSSLVYPLTRGLMVYFN